VTAEQVETPRLESLVKVELDSWTEEDCDLCKRNIPINTEVGHGKDFLARKGIH
jgi:orotate phosphoribosyltransferase